MLWTNDTSCLLHFIRLTTPNTNNNIIIYYVGARVSGIRREMSRVHDAAVAS